MSAGQAVRRYLTNFDSARTGHVLTDVLVVGGGVAGLAAALRASEYGEVVLLTKRGVESSSTYWAQGGVAAVASAKDSVDLHVRDTLTVGCGLNHTAAVEQTCREGPHRIGELINAGLRFDRTDGQIDLGLEGGHSCARVYHVGGDATGAALSRFLGGQAEKRDTIRVFDRCFLIDFLTVEGQCVGAVTFHPKYGHQLIWAVQTILAAGGFGRLFRETTNPPGISGDGVAAAFRAGACVADMEFVQFHPTTLYIAGSSRALVSEAVRGEGAYLVDKEGHRFMPECHADAELAPRDVVSRAIVDRIRQVGGTCVYLDVRHLGREAFAARFPTITARCMEFGIDPGADLIPVRPAAHFSIGGVVADLESRTTVPGLLCCGEASCTGLHGANRLASNSLLEGLVLGRISGEIAGQAVGSKTRGVKPARVRNDTPPSPKTELDLADVVQSLRSVMWRNAGILRHGDRLSETGEIIDFWSRFVLDKTFDESAGWEVQNMLMLARLVAEAAHQRDESRGVHFRSDSVQGSRDIMAGHLAFAVGDGHVRQLDLDLELRSTSGD